MEKSYEGRLKKYPYKMQLKQSQIPKNREDRVKFANKIADKIEENSYFLMNFLFTDEANFHISGLQFNVKLSIV